MTPCISFCAHYFALCWKISVWLFTASLSVEHLNKKKKVPVIRSWGCFGFQQLRKCLALGIYFHRMLSVKITLHTVGGLTFVGAFIQHCKQQPEKVHDLLLLAKVRCLSVACLPYSDFLLCPAVLKKCSQEHTPRLFFCQKRKVAFLKKEDISNMSSPLAPQGNVGYNFAR